MSAPRVLVVDMEPRWSAGGSLWRGFRAAGCEAHFFDQARFIGGWYGSRVEAAARRIARPLAVPAMNFALLARAYALRPEIIVVLKGYHLYPETVAALRRAARALAVWFPDDLRNEANTSRFMLDALPLWDVAMTPRRVAVQELAAGGARKSAWLPFGYDPELHFPTPGADGLQRTVAFVGTWAPEREELLHRAAERFEVAVWGNGWSRVTRGSKLHAAVRAPVMDEALRRVFSGAAVNLALLRPSNRDQHQMRTFEIPACAGFMLATRSGEHRELFEEGKEAAFFDGAEEMVAQIERYIDMGDAAARRAIAEAGHRRLLRGGHSYRDRAQRILELLGEALR
jgi:spore maturation protein CgeB